MRNYGEKKLENVVYHDVTIMGHTGYDELKGSRNEKIVLSVLENLKPHINTTRTEDGRIVLHLHSFIFPVCFLRSVSVLQHPQSTVG